MQTRSRYVMTDSSASIASTRWRCLKRVAAGFKLSRYYARTAIEIEKSAAPPLVSRNAGLCVITATATVAVAPDLPSSDDDSNGVSQPTVVRHRARLSGQRMHQPSGNERRVPVARRTIAEP